MATLSSFFGQSQGSGTASGVITDPRKLPIYHSLNPIYYKYGDSHTWMGDHENDFWYYQYNNTGQNSADPPYIGPNGVRTNRIDNAGTLQASSSFPRLGLDWAQYDSATYTGDWITIMDHTNESGILCYVKGFGAFNATYTAITDPCISKIRITVDGTAYTFQTSLRTHNDISSSTLGYQHPEWGWFGKSASWFTSSYGSRNSNEIGGAYGDYIDRAWFNYDQEDQFGVFDSQSRGTTYLLHPTWFVEGRRPCLTYENSIKVECAVNKYTDTVTNGTGSAGLTNHRYTHRAYAKRIKDVDVII